MRIVLSTIGKFHSFDLARQLHKRGALETIFSGYPQFKLQDENIPRGKINSFPWLHAPFMAIPSIPPTLKRLWSRFDASLFDRHVAKHLPGCDVFCGLSGSSLKSGAAAKRQHARYVCDRGSSHIRFQDRILREEYDRQGRAFPGIDPVTIAREEAEYDLADAITVPSTFALNTFIKEGVNPRKMRLATYGVELLRFRQVQDPPTDSFEVLFVGAISVRKGIDYLLEAFNKLDKKNKRLTFVGNGPEIDELRRKTGNRPEITVGGALPQPQLPRLMSKSHVMVLPSVEEGLALVQAQALACGCPVIATEHTGATDLFTNEKEGFIVPIRDSDGIANRLQLLADDEPMRRQMSTAARARVESFGGWDVYGEKMLNHFSGIVTS